MTPLPPSAPSAPGATDQLGAALTAAADRLTLPSALLLYDGVCGLCDRTVQFLLRIDRHGRLRFAPLQGPTAAAILTRHGLAVPVADPAGSGRGPDSVIFVANVSGVSTATGEPGELLSLRSTAVLDALVAVGGVWRVGAALVRLVPRPLRDLLYDWVARNRYRWFGRFDTCRLPTPAERARFLP